jgi:hypothetical protein
LNDEKVTCIEEYIFQLSGYILTCAEEALSDRGDLRHAILRFLEILKRVIEMSQYEEISEDKFLLDLKVKIATLPRDKNQMDAMLDEVEKLLVDFAEESLNRL